MGNRISKPESGALQPHGTSPSSTSSRASRLSNLLLLRRNAGPYELEGDPNVTRFYELEDDPTQPVMAVNPGSQGQYVIAATYLEPQNSHPMGSRPAEVSLQTVSTARQPWSPSSIVEGGLRASATARPAHRSTATMGDSDRTSANSGQSRAMLPAGGISRPAQMTNFGQSAPVRQGTSKLIKDSVRNAQLTRSIAAISHLLREMYSLDLKIFGMQNARSEDQAERNKMIDQADLIFQKVKTTLDSWEAQSERWTDDERAVLNNVRRTAELHSPISHRTRKL